MQISRHWRMNALRYRLEGVRHQNGESRLHPRAVVEQRAELREVNTNKEATPVRMSASAAR
ncbi:MAG: hypothetical protein KME04_00620 [Pleurocapsa minor GSE-CHR-MK-17-07R]|nr:hypothetical protein [Pleurocapsa minor GSE-CHR-MK 17-07R]